jgi:hypothetical protein
MLGGLDWLGAYLPGCTPAAAALLGTIGKHPLIFTSWKQHPAIFLGERWRQGQAGIQVDGRQ